MSISAAVTHIDLEVAQKHTWRAEVALAVKHLHLKMYFKWNRISEDQLRAKWFNDSTGVRWVEQGSLKYQADRLTREIKQGLVQCSK